MKTRMIPALTAGQARDLHVALSEDLLDRLRKGRFDIVLSWGLEPGEPPPADWLPDFAAIRQVEGDLGERLHDALVRMNATYDQVVAVGIDHPGLSFPVVDAALDYLESGAAMVLGPSSDGGYFLVGVGSQVSAQSLFEDIPWSTNRVYSETLVRCADLKITPVELATQDDVDDPADLARLRVRMATGSVDSPRLTGLLDSWAPTSTGGSL